MTLRRASLLLWYLRLVIAESCWVGMGGVVSSCRGDCRGWPSGQLSWDDRRHVCFHDIRSQRDRSCPLIGRHNTLRRLYRRLLCRNYENVSVLPSYYFRTLQSANSNTTTTARRDGKRRCVRVVPAKLLTPFLFRGKIFYRLFYDDGRRPESFPRACSQRPTQKILRAREALGPKRCQLNSFFLDRKKSRNEKRVWREGRSKN